MPKASSLPAANTLAQNPIFAMSTKILNVYSDAMRQNMENLAVSSARIIQEQTLKAWSNAAQACSKALAENAMANQQQAIQRMTEANRKAYGIMAWDLNPMKMQPMSGFANWFPIPTELVPSTSKTRRVS